MAAVLAVAMAVPALMATETQAAAKKPGLSKSSVSIKVGKSQKISVTKVKAKKIKKTTWSVKSSKIAKLSKKKKTSVTVTGKKAGTTKLTAKIKVGSKSYTKKCTIKVKAGATPSKAPATTEPPADTQQPTVEPSSEPTPVPTLRPMDESYKNLASVPKSDPDSFPDTPDDPKVDPSTAVGYSADFEDVEIGTKTQVAMENGKAAGEGIKHIILRGYDPEGDTADDYLEVVDGSTLKPEGDVENHTHVLKCYRKAKTWQGPMIDLTDSMDNGCAYTLKVDVYSDTQDMQVSTQLQTREDVDETYSNFKNDGGQTLKIPKGSWTTQEFDVSIPDDKYFYGLYFESFNGVGYDDIYIDNITLTKKTEVNPDKTIVNVKDVYKDVFGIVGVGAGTDSLLGANGVEFIAAQFNAYTPGNEMKPDALMGSSMTAMTIDDAKAAGYVIPDNYLEYADNRLKNEDGELVVPQLNFDTVDQIMKVCHEKGLKLRGHTLCWHQQMPTYFFQQNYKSSGSKKYNTTQEVMDSRLEFFIKSTLTHILSSPYADCLYGYDVVNEYLHSAKGDGDGTFWNLIYNTPDTSVKSGVTLRPSYVKKAFQWANEMLVQFNREDVKLFYNDYNCYQYPEDIVHLIDFINEDGKVCDGLGMQSHLNISEAFHSVDNYAKALECFRLNMPEMEIQITELDATMYSTEDNVLTDNDQAAYYDQLMNAILSNKKNGGNITGFILWSLYDGVSWRPAGKPCVFKGLFAPKSAFYAVIGAKEKYYK